MARGRAETGARERAETGLRSVQMALDILEVVAFTGEPVGVTQVATRLALTKGSVFRHLHTLVERGYLSQDAATARYRLGPKAHLLARLAPAETDLAAVAAGPMRELRDLLGLTAVLSAPSAKGALVVQTIHGTTAIEIGVRPGSELAFHAAAQGKIFLAFGRPLVLKRVLRQPLAVLTPNTIHDPVLLEEAIAAVRRRGWATAPEEALLGINALAAPVFDEQDDCVAAVAIVSSIQYVPAEPPARMTQAVMRTAQQISRQLGHRGTPAPSWPATPQAAEEMRDDDAQRRLGSDRMDQGA